MYFLAEIELSPSPDVVQPRPMGRVVRVQRSAPRLEAGIEAAEGPPLNSFTARSGGSVRRIGP